MVRQHAIRFFFLFFFFLGSSVHAQQQVNVDSKLQVAFPGLVFICSTNTFDTFATITNKSSDVLIAPMWLVITGVTAGSTTGVNPWFCRGWASLILG